MVFFCIVFIIYEYITLKGNFPAFPWLLGAFISEILLGLFHYYLSKRYLKVALQFANIQIMLVLFSAVELIHMQAYGLDGASDGFVAAMSLVTTLSMISYN